ncbi:protein of unknown function [Georgfuchsia toluolica]|uniref:Uncharacterized protein n=1 Tax=Georgfuchsia toluolica TaxID=424218 RepID=A0A916J6L6_9PROT|nr:protein of unknown function [Georgfuchsia toluolica]
MSLISKSHVKNCERSEPNGRLPREGGGWEGAGLSSAFSAKLPSTSSNAILFGSSLVG